MASNSPKICSFCTNPAKYTCPRCNAWYCSSSCYKHQDHLQCSEGFYQAMVEEELRSGAVSEESHKKMTEILQRMKAGESVMGDAEDEPLDSDDDELEEDLAVRMADVDLNDSESVWQNLSKAERQEFCDLLNKGGFEDLIPPWNPWWEQQVPRVEEVQPGGQLVPAYVSECPEIIQVPVLSDIVKSSPSPCVPFNILNVLAAYAWTVRLFNGDHQDSSLDATEALFLLSTVLAANTNFQEAAIAVESPKMEAQNYTWLMESEDFATTVKKDVWKILQGPVPADQTFYVKAALSEIHVLLTTSKASLSKKKKSTGGKKEKGLFASKFSEGTNHIELKSTTLPAVKLALKKIEFFLAFVKEYSAALVSIPATCSQ